MTAPLRLGAFLALLAVLFTFAFLVGGVTAPDGPSGSGGGEHVEHGR